MEVVAKDGASCFALLVGVDKYDNIKPLNYAGSDVKAIRETLLKIGFKEENIWMFASDGSRYEQPTKANIERAFKEILAEAERGATIFIALSGHGFETQDGEAAFCPKDVEVERVDGANVVTRSSAIVVNDITAALREDDAKFKLLIVDACREPATAKNPTGATGRPFDKIDASGIALLRSCQTRQLSYEDAAFGGGLFTHYFIEGLNGAADADGDGGVSFFDVCGYVSHKTQERAQEVFKSKQTPHLLFDGSDFWLTEPSGTPSGGGKADVDAAFLAKARQLREAAFSAAKRKDWATAVSKMETSLALVESQSSRDYLARYKKELEGSTDVAPPPKPVVVETDAAKAERLAEEALEAFEAEDWDKALRLAENSLKAAPSPEGVALKKEITDAMCVKALKMNTIIGAFMNAEDYMRERKSIGPTYYVTVLPRESYDLLDKAAKAGHGTAARVLALEYELDGNPAKARRYYRMAAESDDVKAREVARQKLIGE